MITSFSTTVGNLVGKTVAGPGAVTYGINTSLNDFVSEPNETQ